MASIHGYISRFAAVVLSLLGIQALLTTAYAFRVLSTRVWAISMLTAFFVAGFLLVMLNKRNLEKIRSMDGSEIHPALEDNDRTRIARSIKLKKAWIAILLVLLPFGIAKGVAEHEWLLTLGAVGVNQWLVYRAILDIRSYRKRLA